ncbi:hypothetical protein QR680_018250 [Steinernema hermaphroditum]|uniref:G-protein coupled receptors family 1 profile domain-containing protein n=1 Tax=Steinernema hermaphroditum TaxID=289476 RepID=A0AA39LQI8_9BILA|nr:hypothetical protein QR680_018250 [Steinernema hermaphroditum]
MIDEFPPIAFENLSTTTHSALSTTTTPLVIPEEMEICYETEEFQKFQYTVDDMLLAASMAATVFNVMVIFCAVKLFKRSGDTMHLFIINMTLGDLLLTVFCHPNEFLTRKHEFLRHVDLCAVIHFFNWLGLAVSGLSLTMLNIDKLIYFQWPLRYDQTMSKRRAAVSCIFIWGVSFGFVGYVWIFRIVYVTADCILQMTDKRRYFYEVFMIMFCVLPVTSSLVVSIYLFRLTRQKMSATMCAGTQVDMPTFKNKLRSLVFIFTTTAWTSFSLLPYRIFNICRIHLFEWNSFSCEERGRINWLAWMLLYLLTVNPIVNPIITALIYAPYRMTIKRFLINIPIGNRALYSYRGGENQTDTSFLSMRRSRNHRNSSTDHEMSSLRRPDVRVSLNSYDTNWAPIAEEPFIGGVKTVSQNIQNPLTPAGKKTFVYSERPKSSTFPSTTFSVAEYLNQPVGRPKPTMSSYATQGAYFPKQYVRSVYFAPQPAPQPAVQVVPVLNAPAEQQQVAAAPVMLPGQGHVATGQPVNNGFYAQQQVVAPRQSMPPVYQQAPIPVVQVSQQPAVQLPASPSPAPKPENVPVYSFYAMNAPYQQRSTQRVPSSYQFENSAPTPRQVAEAAETANAACHAARQQAQLQLEEAKVAYQQALNNLTSLGASAPSVAEMQAYQREQELLFQQQAALAAAPQTHFNPVPAAPAQVPIAAAAETPVEPVRSSYGYEQNSGSNFGRLQKTMAESMYYGLPNNMMAAYGAPTRNCSRARSRTPSRAPSRQQSQQSLRNGSRFGGAICRSDSTTTAIASEPTPKVATYKIASPPVAVSPRSEEQSCRPAAPAFSEYHFDCLRGKYAFEKACGGHI